MSPRNDPDNRKNRIVPYPLALYEAVHRGDARGLHFYQRHCRGADSVLELGCGSGRVARVLGTAGHRVVGLDIWPEAIAAAVASGVDARIGDMSRFDLGERFDRVIVPFNTLLCLLEPAALVSCFECVAAHLRPDGVFIFDVYAADVFHADSASLGPAVLADWEPLGVVQTRGRRWRVAERSTHDRDQQRVDAYYRHIPLDGRDAPVTCCIPQRYLLSSELPALLQTAGLWPDRFFGDFDDAPLDADSEQLIVIARQLA